MQQAMCQEEYKHKAKCHPCNKPSVMTHEECMQQTKCQEEYMQQTECHPCNKSSVTTHAE